MVMLVRGLLISVGVDELIIRIEYDLILCSGSDTMKTIGGADVEDTVMILGLIDALHDYIGQLPSCTWNIRNGGN
jgi:hypothetical protein